MNSNRKAPWLEAQTQTKGPDRGPRAIGRWPLAVADLPQTSTASGALGLATSA